MITIIQADKLHKSFPTTTAIDHISFEVQEGEVFGLLGPNGSGKTTLVRLLNGVLTPTSGRAYVFGKDVTMDGSWIRARTGVLTETPSLYERLTAKKNLSFFGRFYGIPDSEIPKRTDEMLSLMHLSDRADEPVGGFSKGMKQRLAIARALMHDPPILFLDEPTSGLDPESSRQVEDIIQELASDEKKTIFLCTHNLSQAERLCSTVAMLNTGKILAEGSIQELSRRLFSAVPVEMEFLHEPSLAVIQAVRNTKGVTVEAVEGTTILSHVTDKELIPSVIRAVIQEGGDIFRIAPQDYSLEEIYFTVQRQGGMTV
jgi:ABC-2 type transport system ATP-binding protein